MSKQIILSTTPSPEAIKQSDANIAADPYVDELLNYVFQIKWQSNNDYSIVKVKAKALNSFYNTNIFAIDALAKHIVSIKNLDKRLAAGDASVVNEIAKMRFDSGKLRVFYSFATKYCSFSNPEKYAIYDKYVHQMLLFFKKRDGFAKFKSDDLKDYEQFRNIICEFKKFYGLEAFSFKQIDKYLWQLGIQEEQNKGKQ